MSSPQPAISFQDLPIRQVLPSLAHELSEQGRAVLSAPPGSGKTTAVPLALLEQPWLKGRILMLEPRRLATRAAARRMADLLGERVGATVGYRVRFDHKVSAHTRIEVVTEGILTRRLQSDPELEGVGLVIFDEFHERSIHADLALALCLDVRENLRPDLRLLVMSATLDTAAVSGLLDGAPVVEGAGQSHPVEIHNLDSDPKARLSDTVTGGVLQALRQEQGDMLVFLPGVGEIRAVHSALQERPECAPLEICPLYGDLSREEQDRAILPSPEECRRIVLATSIAETSLTIEGITTVVDSGWSRRPRFDPNSGLTRLETVRVSRAAADQRAGRAGRLGPGVCYRLWDRSVQASLQDHLPPEIAEADLAPLCLELAQWGVAEPNDLKWLTPPPAGAYAQARELLQGLEALDEGGRITGQGKSMAGMGLHPRLAHMLLRGREHGQLETAADLAALLTERDILKRRPGVSLPVDLEQRLELLSRFRARGVKDAARLGADPGGCRRIIQASKQWQRQTGGGEVGDEAGLSAGGLLASAYPDRIAQYRGGRGGYRLSSGRGARLPEGDLLDGSEFLVTAHLDAGRKEGRVYLAAAIGLEELREVQSARIRWISEVRWDAQNRAVETREEERLGALMLSQRPAVAVDSEAVRAAMLEGVREMGLECLPWNDAARAWQARVSSLRGWQPETGWPDLSDETLLQDLEDWLGPWLDGVSRKAHLKRLDMLTILKSGLEWERLQRVEELAPTHIRVPSGSNKRLQYMPGEPPVLAVKLQEMFGLTDTPTVCAGSLPVMLHLLSPAQRPIQVTQDLAGFWARTYTEVKKELKGRYPKHYWPDDPMAAQPTARVRPK